jgi:SRR1
MLPDPHQEQEGESPGIGVLLRGAMAAAACSVAGEWTVIGRKGKHKPAKQVSDETVTREQPRLIVKVTPELVDAEVTKLKALQQTMSSSAWFQRSLQALDRALQAQHAERSAVGELVCYGIGSMTAVARSSNNAKYQLALALCLRDALCAGRNSDEAQMQQQCATSVYDPVMTSLDDAVLKALQITVLDKNEQGKRSVASAASSSSSSSSSNMTVFLMPHCPMRLYSNVLWSNWGANLSKMIVIGNSFISYNDRAFWTAAECGPDNCIRAVLPLCTEESIAFVNNKSTAKVHNTAVDERQLPHIESAFNDTACIWFPAATLSLDSNKALLSTRPPEHTSAADTTTIESTTIDGAG